MRKQPIARFLPILILVSALAVLSQVQAPSAAPQDEWFKAVADRDMERVRTLLGRHPRLLHALDAEGATALLVAARTNQPQLVRFLLELGADPSATDRFGLTPLHRAADNDRLEILERLIAGKAEIDAVILEGYYGYTPLTFAVKNGNLGMIQRLLEAGADIHHRTSLQENYLHFAAALNRGEIAEFLITGGLDVNAPKAGGLTPLHIAAITGHRAMAEMLIRKGAGLNSLSADRGTPLHFAQAAGNREIADLLRKKGALELPRNFPEYSGKYLGQKTPGREPRPFLPESFRDIYRSYGPPVFSPDGKELFWYGYFMPWIGYSRIWWMKEENGRWSAPRVAPFSDHPSWGPAISPDGKKLYFASRRPKDGNSPESVDLWCSVKKDGAWGPARCLGSPPNRDDHNEMLPTVAADGSLYFMAFGPSARGTRIFKARFTDDRFSEPVALDDMIERGLADTSPGIDEIILYRYFAAHYAEISVCFHRPDGRWTRPVYLGDIVHRGHGTNAGVSARSENSFSSARTSLPTGSMPPSWKNYAEPP